MKKIRNYLILILSLLIISNILGLVLYNKQFYDEAIESYNEEDYIKSLYSFRSMILYDYEDNVYYQKALLNYNYENAVHLYEFKQYKEALDIFEELNNYRNSSDYIVKCKLKINK